MAPAFAGSFFTVACISITPPWNAADCTEKQDGLQVAEAEKLEWVVASCTALVSHQSSTKQAHYDTWLI